MKIWNRFSVLVLCVAVACSYGVYPWFSNLFGNNNSVPQVANPLCNDDAPCHDVVMTLFLDGPSFFPQTPGVIERRYALVGFSREETLQEARTALEYFEHQYGLMFSNAEDDALLDPTGGIPSDDGTAVLVPVEQTVQARYRLYTASVDTKTQFFNAPLIGDGGWLVMMTQDRPPAGAYNESLPAGVAVVWGAYIIDQCPPGRDPYLCKNSILTPQNPKEKIFIRFYTDRYFAFGLEPTDYLFLDFVIENKYWGKGRAIGYSPRRHDTQFREGFEMVYAARNVLTWPAYAPYKGI